MKLKPPEESLICINSNNSSTEVTLTVEGDQSRKRFYILAVIGYLLVFTVWPFSFHRLPSPELFISQGFIIGSLWIARAIRMPASSSMILTSWSLTYIYSLESANGFNISHITPVLSFSDKS